MNDDDLFFYKPVDPHFWDRLCAWHLDEVRTLLATVWAEERERLQQETEDLP